MLIFDDLSSAVRCADSLFFGTVHCDIAEFVVRDAHGDLILMAVPTAVSLIYLGVVLVKQLI